MKKIKIFFYFVIVTILSNCTKNSSYENADHTLVDKDPEYIAFFNQGLKLEKSDPNEALSIFESIIENVPLSKYAHTAQFKIGDIYFRQKKYIKAFNGFQKYIEKYYSSSLYKEALKKQYNIAKISNKEKEKRSFFVFQSIDSEEVIKMYEKIISNAPQSYIAQESRFQLANIFKEKGKKNQAIDTLNKLIATNPKKELASKARLFIASIHSEDIQKGDKNMKNVEKAREVLIDYINSGNKNDEAVERKVDKLNYKEAQHNLRIAKFYEKTRKLKSALVYYKEVSNTNFKNLKKYADSRISVLEKNPINSQ